jgi:TonB family protein
MFLPLVILFAATAMADPAPPRPLTDPREWILADDYPPEALSAELQGVVEFRLTIDPAGSITECDISVSSGSALLDARTCALIRERARFTAGVDVKGRAVSGTYTNRVRWQMPESNTARPVWVEQQFALPRPPQPLDRGWTGSLVLASEDMAAEKLAATPVRFTIDVDATGQVVTCRLHDASLAQGLVDAACNKLRSRSMEPARDVGDQPTAGRLSGEFHWRDAAQPVAGANPIAPNIFKTGKVGIDFLLDADGRIRDCSETRSGDNLLAQNMPELCNAPVRFEPFRDATGKAEKRSVRLEFAIENQPAPPAAPQGESQ